jgi:hypothetical protein
VKATPTTSNNIDLQLQSILHLVLPSICKSIPISVAPKKISKDTNMIIVTIMVVLQKVENASVCEDCRILDCGRELKQR